MVLKQLKAAHFKNYSAFDAEFSPKFNCIVGDNGMGKTNLLDAIYYVSLCKSHFRIPDQQLVQREAGFFRLDALLERENKDCRLVVKVEPSKQKTFEKDGKKYKRLSDHIGWIPIVMIAPDDTVIGTGGSEERRRVMDETLCQVNRKYLEHLMLYNKVLKQRNAALKMLGKRRTWNENLIASLDAQLVEPARFIHQTRKEWMEPINAAFLRHFEQISKGVEEAALVYESKLTVDFQELLEGARERDRILQRTTCGIHKDDLIFSVKGMPVKRIASQGQLKSFILALRLAQYSWLNQQTSQRPILLLDDIFDKLDGGRVNALIELLSGEEFGQVFISDTSIVRLPSIFKESKMPNRVFEVQSGDLKQLS